MDTFVADFETTTNPEDCRVWAYAICEVGNKDNVEIGTTIDDFMDWCKNQKKNPKVFFHNLKFDGQFILQWLFHNGFEHVIDPKDKKTNTFTTLISDKGLYYQIEVFFYRKGKNVKKVIFQDSLKLIPMSVDKIAKTFDLPISKLEIDYAAHNNLPVGSELTDEEKDYIINDVKIVAYAVEYFHSQGLDKMTIGSCALDEYKKLIKKKSFERWYPTPTDTFHEDVKQSYRGGFTYLNPKFAGKTIKNGVVLDVNSLYPSVMYGCDGEYLPFGTPLFFEGEYVHDPIHPIYTQMFSCIFELKKGKIPTIQIKHSGDFRGNEYLESSNGKEVVLCLNSVDLKLFHEQYKVHCYEPISGWKFKATKGLFQEYIDKWSGIKIQAKKDGNPGLYVIAKLFLNSLYGKFGTDNKVKSKIPYLGEDDVIHFKDSDEEHRDGVYIAMASFITSYARLKTIRAAQTIMDNYNSGKSKIQFVYADTDSLHCYSPDFELPSGLDIDDTKLGAWKYESKFNKAKFLRQKCYIENSTEEIDNDTPEYELKITVAGMPKGCYPYVTFNNFKIGASYQGKMQPKMVKGGVVLADVDFTIKP
jgi:hypothetical protein